MSRSNSKFTYDRNKNTITRTRTTYHKNGNSSTYKNSIKLPNRDSNGKFVKSNSVQSENHYGFQNLTNPVRQRSRQFASEHRVGIFRGVLLILLVFMIVGVLTNGDSYNGMLSFSGFLKVLEECPMIPTDWLSFGTKLPDSVKDIPFIGSFVELITQIASVLMFFVVGIANAIWIILYFLIQMFS